MTVVRILHIVNSLNRGGMESRIMDLYRHIDNSQFQFDFYVETGRKGVFEDEIQSMGGKVFYMQGFKCLNLPNFFAFDKFLTDYNYKIVYAYNQWAGWYLKIAKKHNVPYRIANSRTALQKTSIKNFVKNLVKNNVNKYATHRFAVSKMAGDWLFGDKQEYTIWPNAINAMQFCFSEKTRQSVRETLGIKEEFTVIHVGNLRYEKNHEFLLSVFNELCKKNKSAKLILVGRGNNNKLKEKIIQNRLNDNVIFLGGRNDVADLLNCGDVFIFPSIYEGFPGAVLEAQANGLPCLISDTITPEVMVTKHIASLSLACKPEIWANKINKINKCNREEAWKEIVKAGYDINELAKGMESFWNSLN